MGALKRHLPLQCPCCGCDASGFVAATLIVVFLIAAVAVDGDVGAAQLGVNILKARPLAYPAARGAPQLKVRRLGSEL